ncbi:Copper resistance protein B [Paraburkholderia caribensis]|nr:Copper resistance protein B [Paraburkholderia caribensis]
MIILDMRQSGLAMTRRVGRVCFQREGNGHGSRIHLGGSVRDSTSGGWALGGGYRMNAKTGTAEAFPCAGLRFMNRTSSAMQPSTRAQVF